MDVAAVPLDRGLTPCSRRRPGCVWPATAVLFVFLQACAGRAPLGALGLAWPVSAGDAPERARVCGHERVALPDGWRVPEADEVADAWRAADPEGYLGVEADLNGDAVRDEARLLVRADRSAFGIFAFLCGRDIEPRLVLHNRDLPYFRKVGLKRVSPGVVRTACGKDVTSCGYPGEPRQVELAHDAFSYFNRDRSAALFYWREAEFKWVALRE